MFKLKVYLTKVLFKLNNSLINVLTYVRNTLFTLGNILSNLFINYKEQLGNNYDKKVENTVKVITQLEERKKDLKSLKQRELDKFTKDVGKLTGQLAEKRNSK